MIRSVFAGVVLACLAGAAPAQERGDPEAGRQLAEAHCSRCHDIAPGGAMKQFPPAFAAIAAYRSADIIPYRIMFPGHMSIMPEFYQIMEPADIDDLTAFILSLEG